MLLGERPTYEIPQVAAESVRRDAGSFCCSALRQSPDDGDLANSAEREKDKRRQR
jgi:hypothetical protein